MKTIPYEIIKAAKENDTEAAQSIVSFFEGYIARRALCSYTDDSGMERQFVDEDLRYLGEIALYAAIFQFQFKEPPDDFES